MAFTSETETGDTVHWITLNEFWISNHGVTSLKSRRKLETGCPAKFYAKHTQFAHCLKEHYNQIIKEERGSFEKFLQDSQSQKTSGKRGESSDDSKKDGEKEKGAGDVKEKEPVKGKETAKADA